MNLQSSRIRNSEAYGFVELVNELMARKWIVAAVVVTFCLAGIVAGLLLPKEYTASLMFEPILSQETSGALGGMSSMSSSGLGGLAALAGITLPGKSEDEQAIAVLQSELLTQRFIQDNDLLPVLYSGEWNAKAKKWSVSDAEDIPTLWRANKFFAKKVRKVAQDQKTGLYVLSIRWKNPMLAAQWANQLVAMTNDYLRNQAVREGERNIKYLKDQAEQTTNVELKQAIYSLLEDQIDKEMIARGRKEYALKVIDPAFVPEKPSSLGPIALGIIGFLLGGVLCSVVLFFRGVLRTE